MFIFILDNNIKTPAENNYLFYFEKQGEIFGGEKGDFKFFLDLFI